MGLPNPVVLEKVRQDLNLSPTDLYVRSVGLTGVASEADVDGYLVGLGPVLDAREHNKLVLALNECSLEHGRPDRLPFVDP